MCRRRKRTGERRGGSGHLSESRVSHRAVSMKMRTWRIAVDYQKQMLSEKGQMGEGGRRREVDWLGRGGGGHPGLSITSNESEWGRDAD